jgi:hypothetical protein
MKIKLGALSLVVGLTALLGACSSIERKATSEEPFQPIDQFVKANDEEQSSESQDTEMFVLEQQTPEGEIFEPENAGNEQISDLIPQQWSKREDDVELLK